MINDRSFKAPSEYGKVIALTFDDGPSGAPTDIILDTLEQYNARASFFLIGDNITDELIPKVRRQLALGCEINSHSKTHQDMSLMSADTIAAEMAYTDRRITSVTGIVPRFFRPPYIAVSDTLFETVDKPFICGVGCDDWDDNVPAERIIESVLGFAEDGLIVLLHDGEENFRTPEAVETLIPELQSRGYELVTVSELFHAKGITPSRNILYSKADQTTMYL